MSIKRKFKKKLSKFDSKHSKLLPTISYFNRVKIISLIEADVSKARVGLSKSCQDLDKTIQIEFIRGYVRFT
jgi:hypothetical protein